MEPVGSAMTRSDAGAGQEPVCSANLLEAVWRKSSWSSFNGNCVEVAELRGGLIGVRDTKNAGLGPVLLFEGATWRSFIDVLKKGDLPH